MPEQGQPLDGTDIRNHLLAVADHLRSDGEQHVLIVVGGSLLAWHGLRDTTTDVDSVRRIPAELQAAVEAVAADHDLSPRWLNDNAAGFRPATLHADDCDVLLDRPRLLVLGAPLAHVFVMKMYAARDRDIDDLAALWPRTGFRTPQQAADAFWLAYPHAPDDPYLAGWIEQIASRSPGDGSAG